MYLIPNKLEVANKVTPPPPPQVEKNWVIAKSKEFKIKRVNSNPLSWREVENHYQENPTTNQKKYPNCYLIGLFPQLRLYKPKKVFLVHACRVMHMCIHLPNIIKVTVWCTFLSKKFLIRIKHQMKIEFLHNAHKSIMLKVELIIKRTYKEGKKFKHLSNW